jgi:hypothetical protein
VYDVVFMDVIEALCSLVCPSQLLLLREIGVLRKMIFD